MIFRSVFSRLGGIALLAILALGCSHAEKPATVLGKPEKLVIGDTTQEMTDRGQYVYCRVVGPGTASGGFTGMQEVFRYARANGRHRILLDIWDTDVAKLSAAEVIVGTLRLLPYWDFGMRISVHMRDETLPTLISKESFPLGKIRLITLRRFSNMDEAIAWLLRDD